MIGYLIALLAGIVIGAFIEAYRVQVLWGIKIGNEWFPPQESPRHE